MTTPRDLRATVVWFLLSAACSVPAESLYVTDLKTALTIANDRKAEVILYTGRSIFCGTNDPRSYFFHVIAQAYPELVVRSNRYVVCEQFMFAPNGSRGPTAAFFREAENFSRLYEDYHIKVYYPSLTFLDKNGARLNGPFAQWLGVLEFGAGEYDAYETLGDYLAEEHPLKLEQAQSNLVAVVCSTNKDQKAFGLFRYYHLSSAGERQILLDNGTKTKFYRIGSPFTFSVREARFSSGPTGSSVSAVGRFEHSEPLADTETFMVHLNGAWFRTYMRVVGSRPDRLRKYLGLTLNEGEYFFAIEVYHKAVGDALLAELNRLRPAENKERAK